MSLRIAIFGQAAFGKDVMLRLLEAGHTIVAAYAPPEQARPDPLAEEAVERRMPLFRHRRFRRKGAAIPAIVDEYRRLGAELNVLAFVTVILPPEIVDAPERGSLCFHPSLLPRYRGGNAIAWQIIEGERETGVTVFRPDAGVDTGPIVVQRGGVEITPAHTAGTLYYQELYPLGVEVMVEAVNAIAAGRARPTPQDESRASFQGLVTDEVARIEWNRPAVELDRLIRGCDPRPGAHCQHLDTGQPLRLFDGRILEGEVREPPGTVLGVDDGSLVIAARGGRIAAGRLRAGEGKKLPAAEAGLSAGARLG